MKSMLHTTLAASLACLLATSAQAAVVTLDFAEQAPGNCNFVGTTLISQGVKFTKNGSTTGFFTCSSAGLIGSNPTTNAMIDANARSSFDMVLQSGGGFDLVSLQAGARTGTSATGIHLVGTLTGGGTVSTDLLFAGTSWSTFQLAGFSNLSAVSWRANGTDSNSQFLFDNVVLNDAPGAQIPEPTSLALVLAAGLFGGAALRQARRKAA
jgi:hypothetical protein